MREKIGINEVWQPVIEDCKCFPEISRLLYTVLSICYATESVEGVINITRKFLSEMCHSMTDTNMNAKNSQECY